MSIEAVMSRISEIEGRIGALSGTRGDTVLGTVKPATSSTSSTTNPSSTTNSSTFAAALGTAATGATSPAASPSGAAQPATGSAQLGAAAVDGAKKYLGVPYLWGGTNPKKGLDCSGLVQLVYKELGVQLPRTAAQQAKAGTAVPSLDQARPGDLVVFRGGHHIGIYLGDGKMIHAPKRGDVVKISTMQGHGDIFAIRRIATEATAPATSSGLSRFHGLFTAAEAKYGLPSGLLQAIAKVESGGDPTAVSKAGAQGLMQLMPATARGLGVNAFDPAQAIDGAARLMNSHLKTFKSLDLALAAYNAGPGAVRRHDGIPPYAETQAYVRKVRAALTGGTA